MKTTKTNIIEADFRILLSNKSLLDVSSPQPHIQSSVKSNSKNYKWLDAVYLGTDNKIYFFVTSNDEQIESLAFSQVEYRDLEKMYNQIRNLQ